MTFMNKLDFRIMCNVCKNSENIIVLRKESLSLHKCLRCGTVFFVGTPTGLCRNYTPITINMRMSEKKIYLIRCQCSVRGFAALFLVRDSADKFCLTASGVQGITD